MSDKLEALSQPVAIHPEVKEFILDGIGDATTHDCITDCDYKFAANLEKLLQPLYSQEYVTALRQRAEAAEMREKETSARAAQADLWAKALVELDEKMKEAARILKSGERLALSRAIMILEGQDDD
ncbi:hypothetical protein [Serratia fonticola]|uniref:hypothetical protein n=1 Tax=Serratia fonticola TaxID=47917 RepID=UPI003AAAD104